MRHRYLLFPIVGIFASCNTTTDPQPGDFLDGTSDNPQIGMFVTSTGNAFHMFQLGAPTQTRVVPLGASNSVTPTGLARFGESAAVPLGNAASVAIINLRRERIDRFFLFPSGNVTGAAFVDEETVLIANLVDDEIGRFTLSQVSNDINDRVAVAPAPTEIVVINGTALVVSGNLDENFTPLGMSLVTAVNSTTLALVDSVDTGGTNATAAAAGPDGMLYVLNTEDFVSPGSMAIIDPVTMQRTDLIPNMGVGPGDIFIDDTGLAYISGFFFGTIVWDTNTKTFVRDANNAVCAPIATGGCRGAFAAKTDQAGQLYQVFFGSSSQGLPAQVFVYSSGTFALTDSVIAGQGPTAIDIGTFVGN